MGADFIKMISEVYGERFDVHLASLVKSRTPCGIFFGFEVVPANVAKNLQVILNMGVNVSCLIVLADVQANALRKFIDVPVITLEDFPRFGEKNFPVKPKEVFFVSSIKNLAFAQYFFRHGMEVLTASDDKSFSSVMENLPKLYGVHEMLGDESRKFFCAAIKGRLTGKIRDYIFAPEKQYFLDGFLPTAGDIAIDGGAYDGATAAEFVKLDAMVYAFEMDSDNYRKALPRAEEFGFTLENLGLSDKAGVEKYSYGGTGSKKNLRGKLTANFIDLDTYVAEKNIPRVDYIKLDIEGAELEMLHGAEKTITRCKPKMAVSAYHKLEDLWTLATYIKSLRGDYEFEFRHYQIDYNDYVLDAEEKSILRYFGLNCFAPTPCEMILYCR